jgi:hypothetical protein
MSIRAVCQHGIVAPILNLMVLATGISLPRMPAMSPMLTQSYPIGARPDKGDSS